jgi:hypothetical protein
MRNGGFEKGELRDPTEAESFFESDRDAVCLDIFMDNRVDKSWLPTGSHN